MRKSLRLIRTLASLLPAPHLSLHDVAHQALSIEQTATPGARRARMIVARPPLCWGALLAV